MSYAGIMDENRELKALIAVMRPYLRHRKGCDWSIDRQECVCGLRQIFVDWRPVVEEHMKAYEDVRGKEAWAEALRSEGVI